MTAELVPVKKLSEDPPPPRRQQQPRTLRWPFRGPLAPGIHAHACVDQPEVPVSHLSLHEAQPCCPEQQRCITLCNVPLTGQLLSCSLLGSVSWHPHASPACLWPLST